MVTTRVKWVEGKTFIGTGSTGNSFVIGSGANAVGVSPMQLLLLGLGGCASIDIVDISAKQRQPLSALEVAISGERVPDVHPSPWGQIHMHFMAAGANLDQDKLARAIALSVEKYCGAYATLSGVANITWDYEVTSPANDEADAVVAADVVSESPTVIRSANAPRAT